MQSWLSSNLSTDSRANFVKASKYFSLEDAGILKMVGEEAESTDNNDDIQYEEINNLLHSIPVQVQDQDQDNDDDGNGNQQQQVI